MTTTESIKAEDPRVEMAAVVVHQLRNRLSRVLFGADALMSNTAGPQVAVRLRKGIDDLIASFDQLIELAQLLSGDATLRLEQVDLSALVGAAIDRARPLLLSRRHELAFEKPDEPIVLFGDRVGLDIVIANLLTNAAKFTPSGGHLRVQLALASGHVTLRVRDDGVGIARERLRTLFDGESTRARDPHAPRGLHVGLLLVRRIAELHGGHATGESEGEGRGAEIAVTLPISLARPHGDGTPRALVVSPTPDALAVVLRSWGYQVDSAMNGNEGVERPRAGVVIVASTVAAREPDIAGRIRVAHPTATLIVVGTESDERAPDGFDRALPTPFDADLLQSMIRVG